MSQVFVLDSTKQPLNPVHPGRARLLLKHGKAVVYRRCPFTIVLKRAVEEPVLQPFDYLLVAGGVTGDEGLRPVSLLSRLLALVDRPPVFLHPPVHRLLLVVGVPGGQFGDDPR